jgi:HEAT repeat protein
LPGISHSLELPRAPVVSASVAAKALARSRFWQAWTLLSFLGTVLAGVRVVSSASKPTVQAQGRPSVVAERTPKQAATLESPPTPAPSVDRLFARLALAATATERCALLERLQPSEDPQATYAITAVLERAWFGSVRACATQALGRQPTVEAQSWLLDLAEDPEPEVHRSALEALATRDDAARAAVVNATEAEDLELRVSAALALLKAKRVEGYAAALRVLPSVEDAEALSSLIDALGQSHDPRALPALEDLLDNAEREKPLARHQRARRAGSAERGRAFERAVGGGLE